MGYFKSDVGLNVPKRTGKITSHHDITIESVTRWREYHTDSGITATANDLFKMLQDMHQTAMPAKVRFEILLILKPSLAFLCDELEKLYYRQEILTENLKAIADLAYALNLEMMNGYKLVAHDATKRFFPNKALLTTALANAMHFCIRILFHAFEQHRQPPQNVWFELNSLYLFAMRRQLLHKSINTKYAYNRLNCISDMYKHALLFTMANPHRLRKAELANLMYAMDNWAPLVGLHQAKKATKASLFIIDLKSDGGPKYSTLFPEATDYCYYVDLTEVLNRINSLLTYQEKPEPASKNHIPFSEWELTLPKPFLSALMRTWSQMEERQYHRETAHGFVNVAIGLSSCFHYLDKTTQDKHRVYTCEFFDKSERGYGLKWLQEVPENLVCGEIVGLERDHEWEIGVIRWLKHEEDNVLLLGIQLLCRQAVAVQSQSTLQSTQFRTLLIPATTSQDRHQSDMLITPTTPFKSGQILTLNYRGEKYDAKLEKPVTQTPSFQLFAITYVLEPVKLNPATFDPN